MRWAVVNRGHEKSDTGQTKASILKFTCARTAA